MFEEQIQYHTALQTNNPSTAIKDWFDNYFFRLRVGLIMSIVGSSHLKSGCGKSYTAMRLGEIFDKDYLNGTTAIDKIAWRPTDFAKAMELVENNDRPSQIVIIDEAGILVNAKKWYSFINRGVTDAVMTFRQLRGMAIFVAPSFMSIEKDIRQFVSHLGFAEKRMEEGDRATVRLYLYKLYHHETLPKYYKYRFKMYLTEAQKMAVFDYFKIKHPENLELIDEYEKRARIYKRKIRAGVLELEKIEEGYHQFAEEIITQNELIHNTPKGKVVYPDEIEDYYNVTVRMARQIARRVNEELMKTAVVNNGGN